MDLEYISEQQFSKIDYTLQPLPKAEYEQCAFNHCDFSNSNLSGSVFIDCSFTDSNMMMLKVGAAAFRNVQFRNCKLLGVRFDQCDPFLFSAAFQACILNLTGFYKMIMKKTGFIDCAMHEVDFTEADLTQAIFKNCDLLHSVFDRTILLKADLRTAVNYSIDPDKNVINKARVDIGGLPGFLEKYDLDIK